uniref:TSA: Wollemia nobilis Ref_Wollemi_Transcript_12123_1500 transcribed RNA sequence n=1 Tax=Wollemia nobilis TaxID=56998 RepID=A0A0C9RUV3_9CONI
MIFHNLNIPGYYFQLEHCFVQDDPCYLVAVAVAVARPKVNPFGDAKPREEVLQERGKDWKKIDFELEHRSVERPETEEERNLKEEIYALKKLAEETVTDEAHGNGLALREHTTEEKRPTLKEEITLKEKKLELLIRELDDKVRFGKKGGDSRPGSASGRSFEHSGRPMSQSGLSEGGRRYDSFERPRSRGGEDRVAVVRTRPSEEKRGMYMERSFSNRSRLSSEERW